MVLSMQFISIPDERYDEYRRSSDFIKEYIFPGGCLPSFSRVTSAMASASRLWLALIIQCAFYIIFVFLLFLLYNFCFSFISSVNSPNMYVCQNAVWNMWKI